MIREFVSTEILGTVTRELKVWNARLRAPLVGTQVIGVAMLRYVIALEPLAPASPEDLADMIALTLQRLFTEDGPETASVEPS